MSKLIVTHYNNSIIEATTEDGSILDLKLFDKNSDLDNIYIGKVENVIPNLEACFIDYGGKVPCYYSLIDNKPIFTNLKKDGKLKAGDEILIQIEKEAIKTKNPVGSSNISLRGEALVLNLSGKVGISSKITEGKLRNHLKELTRVHLDDGMGCIIRTKAVQMEDDKILEELYVLQDRLNQILNNSRSRTCFSCLYHSLPDYVEAFINNGSQKITEIISDDEDILNEFKEYLEPKGLKDIELSFYQDKMLSLSTLYNLRKEIENALKPKVWLKSGAYLVIEQTEAMVVIDVNTGKAIKGKSSEEHFLKINCEAAKEACRQMRLRNLSGIIVIDFINMRKYENMEQLKQLLIGELNKDPVPAKFVDITKLELIEITRKKIHKSLKEHF